MKARTQITHIPTLYGDTAATLSGSPSIASRFPLFGQIDSSLYRERSSNLPILPTSRETLNLLVNLLQTITGANFLLYSSTGNEYLYLVQKRTSFIPSTIQHSCVLR